jgi:hypothetical protein
VRRVVVFEKKGTRAPKKIHEPTEEQTDDGRALDFWFSFFRSRQV